MTGAPFAAGDRIFPRTRPLFPAVTVLRCDWYPGGWVVHWEDRYHPDCTPVTGCGPVANWALDRRADQLAARCPVFRFITGAHA